MPALWTSTGTVSGACPWAADAAGLCAAGGAQPHLFTNTRRPESGLCSRVLIRPLFPGALDRPEETQPTCIFLS